MPIRSSDGLFETAFKDEGATALYLSAGSFPEIEFEGLKLPLTHRDLALLTNGRTLTSEDIREHAGDIADWLQRSSQLKEAIDAGRPFSTSFVAPICGKRLSMTVQPGAEGVTVTYRVAS